MSGQSKRPLLKMASYSDGKVLNEFILNKSKLLIGNAQNCDISINDQALSYYHAIIFIDPQASDGIEITDLKSTNGVWLNNQKIEHAFAGPGDEIRIGTQTYIIEEAISIAGPKSNSVEFMSVDASIKKIKHDNLPVTAGLKPMEGLEVIDNEYCNIKFDEHVRVINELNLNTTELKNSYIDSDIEKDSEKILRNKKRKYLEFLILCDGHIISAHYRTLKKGKFYLSTIKEGPRFILIDEVNFDFHKELFLTIEDDYMNVHCPSNFHFLHDDYEQKSIIIKFNQMAIVSYKGIQIFVKITDAIEDIKLYPFFRTDKNFIKQASMVFASFFVFMTAMLMTDTSIEKKEVKKLAIIYKVQEEEIKRMKAEDPVNNNSNPGQNIVDEPPKQQKEEPQKQIAKIQEKEAPPQNQQPKHQEVAKVDKPKPIKTYKFDSSKTFSSVFKNTSVSTDVSSKTFTQSSNVAMNAKQIDTTSFTGNTSVSSRNPSALSAKGALNSLGGRGLISKDGIDTNYSNPKTVVLGSMDPEILRKLLREYLPQFRHCYQQELGRIQQKLDGVISLDFRIGPNGKVVSSDITMKKTTFTSDGQRCFKSVLNIIKFPSPKGGGHVDVTQPLNFYSEREVIN